MKRSIIADYLHNSLEHTESLKEASTELSDLSGISRSTARELIKEWERVSPLERTSMTEKGTESFLQEFEKEFGDL